MGHLVGNDLNNFSYLVDYFPDVIYVKWCTLYICWSTYQNDFECFVNICLIEWPLINCPVVLLHGYGISMYSENYGQAQKIILEAFGNVSGKPDLLQSANLVSISLSLEITGWVKDEQVVDATIVFLALVFSCSSGWPENEFQFLQVTVDCASSRFFWKNYT